MKRAGVGEETWRNKLVQERLFHESLLVPVYTYAI